QPMVRDVTPRNREEQRAAEDRPHEQRLQIAQLPERRRDEEDARRIGPVLSRIIRTEQRFECAVILGELVVAAWVGGRRRAAIHPEIQEVAPNYEAGAVTREWRTPRHRVEIAARGHNEE